MSTALTSSLPHVRAPDQPKPIVPLVPFKPISVRTALWSVLLGVGVVTPIAVAAGLLPLPEGGAGIAAAQQRWIGYALHPGALALKALLLAPLLEELFYRGLVLQLFRRYCPVWVAVVISSAFFGITHAGQGWVNAVTAFALGSIFAWLVVRTRSLFASMLCHSFVNFTWLFLVAPAFGLLERIVTLDLAQPPPSLNLLSMVPAWWLILSVVVAGTACWMLRKDNPRSNTA